MPIKKFMDFFIAYHETQAVQQFKPLVGHVILFSYTVLANGRFINDLHCYARLNVGIGS